MDVALAHSFLPGSGRTDIPQSPGLGPLSLKPKSGNFSPVFLNTSTATSFAVLPARLLSNQSSLTPVGSCKCELLRTCAKTPSFIFSNLQTLARIVFWLTPIASTQYELLRKKGGGCVALTISAMFGFRPPELSFAPATKAMERASSGPWERVVDRLVGNGENWTIWDGEGGLSRQMQTAMASHTTWNPKRRIDKRKPTVIVSNRLEVLS